PATLTQKWVGGVMLTWDPVALTNTVKVGPVVYTNLTVVNGGLLAVGPVMLAKTPGGYTIMGGMGAAHATVTTTVKSYPATGSRAYNASSAFIGSPDGDNNLYLGAISGTTGVQALWTFDGATLRTDVAGATITVARMYLYCTRSDSPKGDLNWFFSTLSTIPTTFPATSIPHTGADQQNLWTPPGWGSFDILSQMNHILLDNANSVLVGPAQSNDAYTAFSGYGASAALRPYIQVTYQK
ncbi:MAG: hypothetical protein ACRDS0_41140, partial [Pseudonocardiaceae bacterium]